MSDATFEFEGKFLAEAERNIAKYPHERRQSAILALLFLAQEQNHENGSYVTEAAMRKIAEMLGMPYIRVMEVATFFTQINLAPIGKFHIQLCGTTPCMLRGAVELRVTLSDGLATARRCDCSYCRRRAAPVVSAPLDKLEVLKGRDALTLYEFGTHTAQHYFCATCGIYMFHKRRSNPNDFSVQTGYRS